MSRNNTPIVTHLAVRDENHFGAPLVWLKRLVGYRSQDVCGENLDMSQCFRDLFLFFDVENISTGENIVVRRQLQGGSDFHLPAVRQNVGAQSLNKFCAGAPASCLELIQRLGQPANQCSEPTYDCVRRDGLSRTRLDTREGPRWYVIDIFVEDDFDTTLGDVFLGVSAEF